MAKLKISKEKYNNFIKLATGEIAKKQREIKQLQGFIDKYREDYEEGEEEWYECWRTWNDKKIIR